MNGCTFHEDVPAMRMREDPNEEISQDPIGHAEVLWHQMQQTMLAIL